MSNKDFAQLSLEMHEKNGGKVSNNARHIRKSDNTKNRTITKKIQMRIFVLWWRMCS